MKKQDQNPSGFGKLVNEMYGNPYETEGTTDIDSVTDPDHVGDIEKKIQIIKMILWMTTRVIRLHTMTSRRSQTM